MEEVIANGIFQTTKPEIHPLFIHIFYKICTQVLLVSKYKLKSILFFIKSSLSKIIAI